MSKKISLLDKRDVLKKLNIYRKKIKKGEYALQLVELNYNNSCNFDCVHCFSKNMDTGGPKLAINDIKNLADQAHEIGVWQWHLQGGEPMSWDNLDEIINAIDPGRFHFFITSNGWYMTEEKAKTLAALGVDKVSISIDSFNRSAHDSFRRKAGAFDKAFEAMEHVANAGMQVNINTCVSSENIYSKQLIEIIEFAGEKNYTVLLVIATPTGAWAGRNDLLVDENGIEFISGLKKKYPFIHRDLYPLFNFEWGCRTMNGLIYVAPNGDVLSCPFIHIKTGNILDEPLKDILQRGWRVKYFRDFNARCLAGEDDRFIREIIPKYTTEKGVISFEEAFEKSDLYDK